jgi:hypothetical protein
MDYDEPPRGRVVYDTIANRFIPENAAHLLGFHIGILQHVMLECRGDYVVVVGIFGNRPCRSFAMDDVRMYGASSYLRRWLRCARMAKPLARRRFRGVWCSWMTEITALRR